MSNKKRPKKYKFKFKKKGTLEIPSRNKKKSNIREDRVNNMVNQLLMQTDWIDDHLEKYQSLHNSVVEESENKLIENDVRVIKNKSAVHNLGKSERNDVGQIPKSSFTLSDTWEMDSHVF